MTRLLVGLVVAAMLIPATTASAKPLPHKQTARLCLHDHYGSWWSRAPYHRIIRIGRSGRRVKFRYFVGQPWRQRWGNIIIWRNTFYRGRGFFYVVHDYGLIWGD